ncbi:MAG: PHP domain-containing protein [bacterium]
MKRDYHTHSKFSDGEDLPEVLVESAIEVGLTAIAITDHIRADSDWVWDYIDYISEVANYYKDKIRVVCGLEAKITDLKGNVDIPEGADDYVDIVLASVHRIPTGDGFLSDEEILRDKERAVSLWAEAIIGAIGNPSVSVIAHPGLILKRHEIEIPEDVAEMVASKARGEAVAFEYNIGWGVPEGHLLDALIKSGASFIVGSDSHSASDIKRFWGIGYAGESIPDVVMNRLVVF